MITRLRALLPTFTNAARMSTVVHNNNAACCSIPPVNSDYTPKGSFKSYAGFNRVYVTGPENKDKTIVCVFDIFGFKPQTQQGADIVASTLGLQVFMPDFFEPKEPWPVDKFPPQTEEDKQKLQEFFGGPAKPDDTVAKLIRIGKALKSDGHKFVGNYGFCWGGKVTILSGTRESTPFDAVAAVHPAMLSGEDGNNLKVPLGLYPSNDEPVDEYKQILKAISEKPWASKNDTHHYTNMFHGFAAARGDLNNAENKKEYEDLYTRLSNYFKNASA